MAGPQTPFGGFWADMGRYGRVLSKVSVWEQRKFPRMGTNKASCLVDVDSVVVVFYRERVFLGNKATKQLRQEEGMPPGELRN